jgi:hypothetical protein
MLEKIEKKIKKLSIYGLDFHLLYQKNEHYSTICDLFLSFIFILIFLFLSYLYLKDIFITSQFSIVTNSIQLKGKNPINLSSTPIMFSLFNYKGENIPFDKTYMNMNLYKTNCNFFPNKTISRTKENIKLELCSKENLPEYFLNQLNDVIDYSKFLCISKGQNLTIAGRYGDPFNLFDILEFHISKCDNSTNICKSEKDIKLYFLNSYVQIIYLSYFIDHFNKSCPIHFSINSNTFIVTLNNIKRYYKFFTPAKYISENGLIFKYEKTYNFFESKEIIMDNSDKEELSYFSSQNLMEITFSVDSNEINYNRKYIKLQEAIGNIGGCVDILFGFFKYISFYFSEKCFLIEISSSFFNKSKFSKMNQSNIKNSMEGKKEVEQFLFLKKNSPSGMNSIKNYCDDSINKLNIINKDKGKILKDINCVKNNYLNIKYNVDKSENNESNKTFNTSITSSKKVLLSKEFTYSIFDYCLPFYLMKKMNHKDIIQCYENILKKYLSIEVIIPILERINDNIIETNKKKNFFFKTDSCLELRKV